MIQAGLINKWVGMHVSKGNKCDQFLLETKAKPITLSDISGALVVLAVGIILATINLAGEFLYLHCSLVA